MTKVLGVIPARYASTRFPGKPLALILGRPMVQWVYEAAQKAVKQVVVATDDKRIFKKVRDFGGNVLMTPRSLPTGTDRMAYVAKKLGAHYYVNIQGDEPLIRPQTIKQSVSMSIKTKSVATAATHLRKKDEKDPHVVKVVTGKDHRALYFSRQFIPLSQKHMGLYVYPRKTLMKYVRLKPTALEKKERLEQLRAMHYGIPIYVALSRWDSVGVDTRKDLKKVLLELKK